MAERPYRECDTKNPENAAICQHCGAKISLATWQVARPLGPTSLVLSVVALAAFAITASAFLWMDRAAPGLNAIGVFLVGLITSLSTASAGLLLGIGGLLNRRERRLLPTLGTAVSIAVLFAWLYLRLWR